MFSPDQFAKGIVELSRLSDIQYEYNSRDLVFQCDKIKLYHYHSRVKKPHQTPMLVVFATVNRPEVLDLFPESSFIRSLLDKGMDVYLLDWGYPDQADKTISMDDYVFQYLKSCVGFIKESTKQEAVNLLGVCQGGVLCLCYASLFDDVNKLTLISTPVDFQTKDNLVHALVRNLDVSTLASMTGNIPGNFLTSFFISLRPFDLLGKKYLHLMDKASDQAWTDRFLRVEKWLHDAPDQTGASFTQFMREYYRENKLLHGTLLMRGKPVDPRRLRLPVLNIMARGDTIVPPSASRPLKRLIPPEYYRQAYVSGGHIGIYVNEESTRLLARKIAGFMRREAAKRPDSCRNTMKIGNRNTNFHGKS